MQARLPKGMELDPLGQAMREAGDTGKLAPMSARFNIPSSSPEPEDDNKIPSGTAAEHDKTSEVFRQKYKRQFPRFRGDIQPVYLIDVPIQVGRRYAFCGKSHYFCPGLSGLIAENYRHLAASGEQPDFF